ncbi:predicted protein [Sclerotinia sclerotiorum 1980 UF-70]|uniref:Uncharacterized protein n=2 Tax=Sclerotinia sclerotiorum (strain ATCC 18683 / 1980 / Ss-1) TaxID=665079 RepID=A7F9D8_SCLS1|nr:predicted protein [Sclerotinia sclerotiorum 1980 UF-70]APA09253.1 hypothetical protein sscle_04g040230 [Sclerotinia sclerotiorum 1980 UF-70]EDO00349.1 predicted protein [Sclerotinia sclerotiorum 1980 UF-70]
MATKSFRTRIKENRIQRVEWVELFQKIRTKALNSSNIKANWKGAGLTPFSPRKVLDTLPFNSSQQPSTSQIRTTNQGLDFSILRSSPPNGTELRQANQTFNSALAGSDFPASSIRRYVKRMTRFVESQNAEIILFRKQFADEKPKEKKPGGRPRKHPIEELEEETEEEELENSSNNSELELEECVARRTRSHVK